MGTLKFLTITNETAQQAGRTDNYFGDKFYITFGNYDGIFNNYWATLKYKVGDMTAYQTVNAGGLIDKKQNLKWVRFTVDSTWMEHVKTSTSATLTLWLKTYETSDGSISGGDARTKTLTFKVPPSVKPTMNGLSAPPEAMIKPFNDEGTNKLLKGISSLVVSMSGDGIHGSTITRYFAHFTNNTTSHTILLSSQTSFKIQGFTEAGSYVCDYGYVQDSRLRYSEHHTPSPSIAFEVLDYTQPILSQATAIRVSEDPENPGTYIPDATGGKYIKVKANVTIVDPDHKFQLAHPIKVTVTSTDSSAEQYIFYIDDETDTILSLGGSPKEFSVTKGYRVRFEALDKVVSNENFGLSADYKLVAINSTTALLNGRDYAAGIAFGKYAEEDGVAEFNPAWDIKKKGEIEADFVTNVTASGLLKEIDLLSGLGFKEGTSLNWQGAKIVKTDNGVTSTERQDATYIENGYNVQEFLSGKKERWKTVDGWTVLELISGIKVAIKRFEFTNVVFDQQSGSLYQTDYLYITNPPFEPDEVFATLRGGVRWVVNASFASGYSGIRVRFGSGTSSNADSLTGSVMIIGL